MQAACELVRLPKTLDVVTVFKTMYSPGEIPFPAVSGRGLGQIRFTTSFLVPMAAILGASFLSLLAAVAWLIISQNDMAARREQQVVGAAVNAKVDFLRELNRDYSVWNDAVEHVVLNFDSTWLTDQIGNYLLLQRGIEKVYVLSQDGTAVYARAEGKPSGPTSAASLGSGFERAFNEIRSSRLRASQQIGGVTRFDGEPMIFSLSRIRPDKPTLRVGHPTGRYLVLIKHLDADVVADLADAAQLPTLAVTSSRARREEAGARALMAYDGTIAGYLTWNPQLPGSSLLQTLVPLLAGLFAALLYLGIVVMRHARLGIRQASLMPWLNGSSLE